PLKENLAAAILLLADWPQRARSGASLIDPMCGSGTLLLEAALMAGDVAPRLSREHPGCGGWRGHDRAPWARLRGGAAARGARGGGVGGSPPVRGYDADARAVSAAHANLRHAKLDKSVHVERRVLAECAPVPARDGKTGAGVLVTNPPYGARLGDAAQLAPL